MKLTRRENEIISYVLAEAKVMERASSGKYIADDTRAHYRGSAAALHRLAGEILEGKHREHAKREDKERAAEGYLPA